MKMALWLSVLLFLCPSGFAQSEKERVLYTHLARDAEAGLTLLTDATVVDYANRLASRLDMECPGDWPIQVRVVDSEKANGFALPGGFLFVNTGLIRSASSEAELAAILAHLIVLSRQFQPRSGSVASGMIFTGNWVGYSYAPGSSILMPSTAQFASRTAIGIADRLGAGCAAAAGYDPSEFIRNLEKLRAAESRRSGQATLGTHPPFAERIREAESVIAALPPRADYLVTTVAFDDMKSRLPVLQATAPKPAPSLRRSRR